mmetsp:Transcript_12947/g.20113  ORF Transcript_12947/g.20113 Transcript_12947/m.20113 type:complete len:210 (+) Transcript_12947:132-761(+)
MSTAALVAFLRAEADSCDERALRLRTQAETLALEHHVTGEMQANYELDPEEMAPLDEHGIPKYKGRKRGRKAKKRKRPRNPDRPKRQHTAYTLFVQETYPGIRDANSHLQSKDLISMVAQQWKHVLPEDKQTWKTRAAAAQHPHDQDQRGVGVGASASSSDTTGAGTASTTVPTGGGEADDTTTGPIVLEEEEDGHGEEEEDDDDDVRK